jgi:N-acetylglucosaminyldiphosphoundecaprenol N-acetyl-beta-D-mannosaminyltransferase
MSINAQKKIISLNVVAINYNSALQQVMDLAQTNTPSYACFANVHMIIEAYKNADFKKIVNDSTFSFPDGMPLVFAFKALYGIKQDRVAGIDFMTDALKECEKKKLSVFLFGSTTIVLEALGKNISKDFPNLIIAGKLSPPFKEFSTPENDSFIQTINDSGANMVFVSLGCPKQEIWMAKHYDKIKAPLLGVGAAFEIHAKLIERAPVWMQKAGLEWLYRFIQEPARLWKRYMVTNSLFVFLLIKEILVVRLKFKNGQ